MHPHRSDLGQGYRSRAGVADPDYWPPTLGLLVPEPERRRGLVLLLEPRMPNLPARPLAATGVGPRSQSLGEIRGGFLEHLLADRRAPREPGHDDVSPAVSVDSDLPTCSLGFLPGVEDVDQVETSPWHGRRCMASPIGSRPQMEVEALIEREPRRTRVPSQRLPLLDRRVEAEAEGGVPGHHRQTARRHRHFARPVMACLGTNQQRGRISNGPDRPHRTKMSVVGRFC